MVPRLGIHFKNKIKTNIHIKNVLVRKLTFSVYIIDVLQWQVQRDELCESDALGMFYSRD